MAALSGFSDIAFAWNFDNYRTLWDPLYGEVFGRTLGLAFFGTVTTLLIGFPFAYWLATRVAPRWRVEKPSDSLGS